MAPSQNPNTRMAIGAVLFLVLGIVIGYLTGKPTISSTTSQKPQPESSIEQLERRGSVIEQIEKRGVIRAGYGGFRPYTISNVQDPSHPTGYLIDVFSEIIARTSPPLKIDWKPVTFETLKADIDSGRIDIFVDGVYQTVPRAQHFLFTNPFGYFGVGVAVVRKDDKRFSTLRDLDKAGVRIALAEGWTSTEFAQKNFKNAELQIIPVGDDGMVPLNGVLAGRSDAALQDVPTVAQFVEAHKDKVRAIGLDNPPARVAASFLLPQGNEQLRDFMNVAQEAVLVDGTVQRISEQWQLFNEFPVRSFSSKPGH